MANSAFSETANEIVGSLHGPLHAAGLTHKTGWLAALILAEALLKCADEYFEEMVRLDEMSGYTDVLVSIRARRLTSEMLNKFLGGANGDA